MLIGISDVMHDTRGEGNLSLFLSSGVSSNEDESKTTMSDPIMPVVQANLVVSSKAKKMTNSKTVVPVR